MASVPSTTHAVVVIDPISTGSHILHHLLQQGLVTVILLWSPDISPATKQLQNAGLRSDAHHRLEFTTAEETVEAIKALGYEITHCVPLSEPGVLCADILADALKLATSNGLKYSTHRRDKFQQLERIREYGLRCPQQQEVVTYDECVQFLTDLNLPCVLKPLDSAGSDDVFKIHVGDFDKLKTCFYHSFNKRNKMGKINDKLLIQEFLQGDEYVMDIVSLHGKSKLVSVWKYMKTALEQGDFVYLGMRLCDPQSGPVQAVWEYMQQVLNALEIKNFASHNELIYNPSTGSVTLIEAGARPHGGGNCFGPLQKLVIGYTLVEVCSAALTSKEAFDAYPDIYTQFPNTQGIQVDMINYNETGLLEGFDLTALRALEGLPTFNEKVNFPTPGRILSKTIDCFTIPGSCVLIGSPEQLEIDLLAIREIERALWVVQPAP